MTRCVGLIGKPLKRRHSQVMHDSAFDAAGIDARYVLLELEPEAVEPAVQEARGEGWLGLGVTAPYKRVVAALVDAVERILGITGRIDLVHCNDSKDGQGSGRDRHANLGTGEIDPELLVAVVNAAGAPVICETGDEGRKDDIAFLKSKQ